MSNLREFYQVMGVSKTASCITRDRYGKPNGCSKDEVAALRKIPWTRQWNPRWGGENRQILDISSLFSSKEDPSIYLVGEVEQEKLTL